jgi:hypothetical protein
MPFSCIEAVSCFLWALFLKNLHGFRSPSLHFTTGSSHETMLKLQTMKRFPGDFLKLKHRQSAIFARCLVEDLSQTGKYFDTDFRGRLKCSTWLAARFATSVSPEMRSFAQGQGIR